jgi:gliding motility-associated-like protein
VTAEDGTTLRTYTLVVTRQISTNANLANLGISGGTLSPAFAAATTTYTSTVNTATITVTPTVSEANATVTVNGTAVPSGTASGPVSLAVGSNVITVKVTAQNGTTVKTYKITVTRPAPSTNANLASLTVNTGTLTPAFDPSVTAYTIDVPTTTTTIKITGAIPADTNAVVRINGAKGQVSPYLQLNPGANTITVSVTAQDGSTVKTYTITVNRALDTNNYLSSLELYTGSYSPSFTSTGTSYTQSLPYTTTQTTIVIRPSSYSASLTINGQSVPFTSTIEGGQPVKIYQKVYALAFGANVFSILVTAESGATRTITVTINRAGPPVNNNANLGNLTVSPGTLTPAFLKTTTNYAVTVPYGTGFVTVTPTTDNQYAHVTVNGSEVAYAHSTTVLTTTGANLITFRVTATDSTTVKTYKLTVTVQPPANNANLSNLTIGTGTLTPAFAPATTSYSVSVPYNTASISVHPTLSDSHGTVAPAGNFTINPPVGTSTTNIVVTAQDGVTKKTYSLTVTRAGSANANLANLDIDAGTLTPGFSSSTASYTASVANSVTQIGTTALTSEANATISVNGGAATTRTSSVMVNLNVGTNVITTKVTAQDGTTVKTYKITVTRAAGASGFGNNTSISYANTESYTPDGSDVTVQQAMSPNGDGLNDRLQIDGIESHPDNKLTIIDRNGTLVYEITGYDNDAKVFDGHSNKTGKLQLPGTYYYVLDYKAGDETKHKTGYLIIKY